MSARIQPQTQIIIKSKRLNITQVRGKKHDPEIVETVDPVCQNDLVLKYQHKAYRVARLKSISDLI